MPRVLSQRDFRLLLLGRFCVLLAAQIASVGIGWHVYAVTESALHLGWVGLVQFIPMLLLTLPAGQAADRFDRRTLGSVAVWMMAAVTGSVGAAVALDLPLLSLYVALAGLGVARAVAGPSLSALLPQLVPEDDFRAAVGWMSSAVQLALVLGPAVGGALYASLSPEVTFFTAAALHAAGGVLLALIRPSRRPVHREPVTVRTVLAGLAYLRQQPILLGAISLDLFAVLLGGATALIPAVARDVLETGPSGLGWLRAAPSIGALLVGLRLSLRPLERRAGPYLLLSVAWFGVSIVAFGLSRSFALSMLALASAGAADMVSVFVRQTLVQLWTPDAMRGRVSAVHMVFITGSNELGEFESGVTAAWLGVRGAIVTGGVGTLAVAAAWTRVFPALRRLDSLAPPAHSGQTD